MNRHAKPLRIDFMETLRSLWSWQHRVAAFPGSDRPSSNRSGHARSAPAAAGVPSEGSAWTSRRCLLHDFAPRDRPAIAGGGPTACGGARRLRRRGQRRHAFFARHRHALPNSFWHVRDARTNASPAGRQRRGNQHEGGGGSLCRRLQRRVASQTMPERTWVHVEHRRRPRTKACAAIDPARPLGPRDAHH